MPFKFSSINQNTSSKKSRDRVIGPFVCRDARTVNVVANGIEGGPGARSFHARSGLGLCGLARSKRQSLAGHRPSCRRQLLSPPCEGGARGGGPVSVECTRGACLARSIDEFDGACAASPALMACRFRSSLGLNGEYTDDAEVLWPTPPAPPSQRRSGFQIAIFCGFSRPASLFWSLSRVIRLWTRIVRPTCAAARSGVRPEIRSAPRKLFMSANRRSTVQPR